MGESYKKDLQIDKYQLDNAWISQPLLFCEWAEKAVEASFERDKAKEQLELTRAELDGKIRSNPSDYGLEKVTESAVSNAIIQDPIYKKANSYFLESVKNAKILDVARESFDHKKKSLEKLTDLFLAGYWAEPKIKTEIKEDFGQKETENQRELLNTKRRRRE
jgi:hypothetical protein